VEVSPLLVQRSGGRFAGEQHGVGARVMLVDAGRRIIAIEDIGDRAGAVAGLDAVARRIPGRIALVDGGERLEVTADALGEGIEGVVTVRVPVYRPAADGGFVKVVFGVAEVAPKGAEATAVGGCALFETFERFPPRRAAR
jgi:hypothetical protein